MSGHMDWVFHYPTEIHVRGHPVQESYQKVAQALCHTFAFAHLPNDTFLNLTLILPGTISQQPTLQKMFRNCFMENLKCLFPEVFLENTL